MVVLACIYARPPYNTYNTNNWWLFSSHEVRSVAMDKSTEGHSIAPRTGEIADHNAIGLDLVL